MRVSYLNAVNVCQQQQCFPADLITAGCVVDGDVMVS